MVVQDIVAQSFSLLLSEGAVKLGADNGVETGSEIISHCEASLRSREESSWPSSSSSWCQEHFKQVSLSLV